MQSSARFNETFTSSYIYMFPDRSKKLEEATCPNREE